MAKQQPAKQQPTKPPPIVTRGLSINQPWAWAIVDGPAPGRGWKPIENRTWPTSFRGTVAVHASTARRWLNEETVAFIFGGDSRIIPRWNMEAIDDDNQLCPLGAIVGTVDIVGCVEFDPEREDVGPFDFEKRVRAAGLQWWLDKYQSDWDGAAAGPEHDGETWSADAVYWAGGPHCFLLDNARQFSQPIPAKGRLNLYTLTPEEIKAVGKALAAPLGCPVEYRAKLKAAGAAAKYKAAVAGDKPAAAKAAVARKNAAAAMAK